MERTTYHIPNIIAFYLVWIWTMISVTKGWLWLGPLISLLIIVAQVAWVHHKDRIIHMPSMAKFAALVLLVGLVTDTSLMHFKFFWYEANPFRNMISPPWMMILWLEVALCLFISGRYFFTHYWHAAVVALLGAGLFYSGMSEFGVIYFFNRVTDTIIISLLWAILLPFCLYLGDFFSHSK